MSDSATAADFLGVLGGFPEAAPLDFIVIERHEGESHIRLLVEYTGVDVRFPAFLLLPPSHETAGIRFPAAVAIHQDGDRTTRDLGKSEPAGLRGGRGQPYGVELCRRGYVVLCPDRPGFETREHAPHPAGGLAGSLYELHRAADCLLAQPLVNPYRIAAIGHSAGSWLATMLAFTDQRIRATGASSGVWLWRW